MLDTLYARLRRCAGVACTGRPFTEHSRFPMLIVDAADRCPAWQKIAETINQAISSGRFAAGE